MKIVNTQLAALCMVVALAAPALAEVPIKVALPSSAKLGQTVNVSVKTNPKLKCKIEAQDAGFTQTLKLLDKTSSKGGKANWKFEIPKDYKADKMPITITVEKDGEQSKSIHAIEIAK